MTDRELLELAAKAAGLAHVDYTGLGYSGGYGLILTDEVGRHTDNWNPLADDGDAFRLASRINLEVDFGNNMVVIPSEVWGEGTDPYAATRRAIVRAAAEIGKDMK